VCKANICICSAALFLPEKKLVSSKNQKMENLDFGKRNQINIHTALGAMSLAASEQERLKSKIQAGGSLSACSLCNKSSSSSEEKNKRCTGCFMVWYCSRECQLKAWEEHKEECSKAKKEYKPVKLTRDKNMFEAVVSQTSGFKKNKRNVKPNMEEMNKKKHFTVKIQISLMDSENSDMLLYNQERTIMGRISKRENKNIFPVLHSQITNSPLGVKGFFRAISDQSITDPDDFELKVNPYRIQTPETW